ncbi:glycosyltransferase family 2 protein [Aeromonas crassostreae]
MEQQQPVTLAVALTTFNSMRCLPMVLDSVQGLAQRIVVVDSGSTDGTREYAAGRGCIVIERPWPGPLKQKVFAMEQCAPARWILLLDSDESLEPELRSDMERVLHEDDPAISAWEFQRKIWFLGGWLHHMYQPEWRLRLVRSDQWRMEGKMDLYHDKLVTDGKVGKLKGICRHDSYADIKDAVLRAQRYAERAVGREMKGGRWYDFIWCIIDVLWRHGIRQRAFLDGKRGLIMLGITMASKLIRQAYFCQQRLQPPKKDWENPVV